MNIAVIGLGYVGLQVASALSKLQNVVAFDIDKKRLEELKLGKDISGEKIYADLEKMPHLLIAGTTGSGKSVGINTMILSLLFKFKPNECKLILIDPKMLELSVYDGYSGDFIKDIEVSDPFYGQWNEDVGKAILPEITFPLFIPIPALMGTLFFLMRLSLNFRNASTMPIAVFTARSASSSREIGAPKTTINSSPTILL